MSRNTRLLYQFPLSLYCEKSRWHLEHKQLPYTCINLLPGPHLLTAWRMARQSTLPILRDGHRPIGGTAAIAQHLEQHYPEQPLLPAEAAARQEVLHWQVYCDELGKHTRRCVWSLAVHGPQVNEIFYHGYTPGAQHWGRWSKPLLRQMIKHRFQVYPEAVQQSWQRVQEGLTRVENTLQGKASVYLVGEAFSLADLTAATMLAPLLGPEESPWPDRQVAGPHQGLREELRQTLAGQWVLGIYARHRQP